MEDDGCEEMKGERRRGKFKLFYIHIGRRWRHGGQMIGAYAVRRHQHRASDTKLPRDRVQFQPPNIQIIVIQIDSMYSSGGSGLAWIWKIR